MARTLRISTGLISLVLLAFASGCSRNEKQIGRANRLESQGHPEQALEIYRVQLAKTPEYDRALQADLQFHMGECLLAMDRTREAFSAYNKAIELDDTHQTAHLRLGELYLLSGSVDHATEQAEVVLNRGRDNLDALSLLGSAASASGNDGIARNAFEDVLEKDPTRVKVALSLAELLNRRGETETARAVLLRAAQAQPKSPAPWLTLGRLEETLGRTQQAEDAYHRAISIEDSAETNLRLAQFFERTSRVKEARLLLLHVDALRPAFRTASADFNLVTSNPHGAQQDYLRALNGFSSPQEKDGRENRARMISRLIEADLASQTPSSGASGNVSVVALARKHLDYFRNEIDPATHEILLAEIAIGDEDLTTAGIHADAAVQLAPESAPAQYVDGIVKLRMDDLAGARAAFESALENDPTHIPSRLALGQLLLDQGDIDGAQSNVVPVVREEPVNLPALILFGHVLLAQNDMGSAQVIASRAEAAAPHSPLPDLLRGKIFLAQHDPGSALIAFQKAVLLDPGGEEAVEGLARAYSGGQVKREMLLGMEKIARAEPASPTLLEISGRLFAEHGWNEDAKRCLASALRIDPTRSSAALRLARALAVSGEDNKASQYAVLVPGISQVLQGVSAEQRGDKTAAIDHYEAAVRAGDRTGIAANNLAWIYAEQESHLGRALEVAQRAVELAPRDAGTLDTLGFVHFKRREYTDAVKAFEHARIIARSEHAPELPDIESHLRAAYISAGQPELAAALREPATADVP
jgi:tetratricopeptide (TPR) repeat protein